jgi:diguanylate cyclase (GGDEF)-like protein
LINFYSILILAAIYFHSVRHSETTGLQNRLFRGFLAVTAILLVVDVLSRFDGNPGTYYVGLNYWGNLLMFLANLVLPALWILYVHNQVVHNVKKTLRLSYYLLALLAANAATVVISLPYGWFYYIDAENIYHRGDYYWVLASLVIAMMLGALAIVLTNRKRIEARHYFSLVFFEIPPFICLFLQMFFYGISLMLNSVVLSLLIVYFNIQNRYIDTDYLTGISNRKRLEYQLKKRIASSTVNSTFSAILIDMDNFKAINDNFGHDVGDDALGTFVKLLKTCVRSGNDIIARFGGDEFYLLLDMSDREQLEASVARIQTVVKTYNDRNLKPYKLEFSLGYTVYDPARPMKLKEFQKQLDTLMYRNKRTAKDGTGQQPGQTPHC